MLISNKEKYRILCNEQAIPLFMQAWWMDAVCGSDKAWDVLLYEENNKIIGALPFQITQKLFFKVILQPIFTQYNGVWIDYPNEEKSYKRYNLEKKIVDKFYADLSKLGIKYFNQSFHHSFTNWQPFYWNGYSQTTKYTYIIDDISDTESVYNRFCPRSKQKHIIKASNLDFDIDMSAHDFYSFHKECLAKENVQIAYSIELFESMHNASTKRNQGQIFRIKDKENDTHTALFVIWDEISAYNLIIAINPKHKKSGASTRIVWEAIKFLNGKTKSYDFEGSMIEGVAYNDQLFGAIQKPYFNIERSYSRTFSTLLALKKLWKL